MQPFPTLDRRVSSVKWQSGMKELEGDCTGGKKAEGGDCRRKDGRAEGWEA